MIERTKVFYGWWVVLALVFVGLFAPVVRYGMTAFFPFISAELGWSRSEIGLAQTLAYWTYAFFVLVSGRLTDRIGGRTTIFVGGFLCFVGWLLFFTTSFMWQLYLYYGIVMAAALSMSFAVPILATGRKWFTKRAGLVNGILATALGASNAIFVPLLARASESFGWRIASLGCAFVLGIGIMLLAFFVVRDSPESMGLKPDGETLDPAFKNSRLVEKASWATREAVKTPQVWLLVITYGLSMFAINGLEGHIAMWGIDLHTAPAAAGIFMTALAVPSIAVRTPGGWLGDRYGRKRIIVAGHLLCALLMLWGWQSVYTAQQLIAFVMVLGVAFGLPITQYAAYLGDLFGRANMGSLFGILTMGYGLIGGLGPFLWGKIVEATGSYNAACLASAGCYVIAALAAFFIRPLATKDG